MNDLSLIILVHDGSKTIDVHAYGTIAIKKTDKWRNESPHHSLTQLGIDYPNSLIGWCHVEAFPYLNIEKIPSLVRHPYELISFTPTEYLVDPRIGYIDFNSPFLNQIPRNIRFSTWQISSCCGVMHALCLQQFHPLALHCQTFESFLGIMSRQGISSGLIPYSEPALLKTNDSVVNTSSSLWVTLQIIRMHYGLPWFFYFWFCLFIDEIRFPFLLYLRALFLKKPPLIKLKSLPISAPTMSDQEGVTVIIPTLNRAQWLKDVLLDLSQQIHLPTTVIIIEQIQQGTESSLPFLKNHSYPFKVLHEVSTKLGACHARNRALQLSPICQWVFFADDDIRLEPETLKQAISTCKSYHVNALTLSVYQSNSTPNRNEQTLLWNTFGSGCSLVDYAYASRIKFDMAFENGFGEDSDYGIQLRNAGCAIAYSSKHPLLHLKAPSGGFRTKIELPWAQYKMLPKPSPTIMLSMIKNHSSYQLMGYKVFLFISRMMNERTINFLRFNAQWKSSVYWAIQLKNGLH